MQAGSATCCFAFVRWSPTAPLRSAGTTSLARRAFLGRLARYRKPLAISTKPQCALSWRTHGRATRELDHAVERAVLMARSAEVAASDLGLQMAAEATSRS